MSEDDLWLIVEGRDHDRPHYERLLQSLPSTNTLSVTIRLAEQIELNQVSAGGKDHALALHDHLERSNGLVHENKAGRSSIVFMLDRDRDDFSGSLRTSAHVFYTYGTDVEADIILNVDIWPAIRAAYGMDTRMTTMLGSVVGDPATSLRNLWHDWLMLSLIALECGAPGRAPWGQPSRINTKRFYATDDAAKASILAALQESIEPAAYLTATTKAHGHIASQGHRLLKGRWIAQYIHALVADHLAEEIVRTKVHPHAVIDTALAALTYEGQWVKEYDLRFTELMLVA